MSASHSSPAQSQESALDNQITNFRCSSSPLPPFQGSASSGQHSDNNASFFSWPTSSRLIDTDEERAKYFGNLQKGVLPATIARLPSGKQATTLLDLMTIRAFHSRILRRFSLGTAVGFRIRRGVLTDIPAIIVFVDRKVHRRLLSHIQCLPAALEGPGGIWCDVDVLEFSYYGTPATTPKEQIENELVDGLRGSDPFIGSGSQIASQESYGTLGAIVRSRTGNRQIGFLTNRHVAVDLEYPSQKMFYPLPPNLGPSVYLGAVERATSFIIDELWFGIFAGTNPESFVRVDGAFIPFAEDLDPRFVTTTVQGVGEVGDVYNVDLQSPVGSLVGVQVKKVGRSSGLTTGTIMAYALEYNDEKGISFFTDFLVVGENHQTFDLEGDSGSLILLAGENWEKPRAVGMIWGGTANRGRLKLKVGQPTENWTSAVDLGRLLDLLELDLITTSEGLRDAMQEQINLSAGGVDSIGESTSPAKDRNEENLEPIGLVIQQIPVGSESVEGLTLIDLEERVGREPVPRVEYQFIPSYNSGDDPPHETGQPDDPHFISLSLSWNNSEENSDPVELGAPQPKRRKQFDCHTCAASARDATSPDH